MYMHKCQQLILFLNATSFSHWSVYIKKKYTANIRSFQRILCLRPLTIRILHIALLPLSFTKHVESCERVSIVVSYWHYSLHIDIVFEHHFVECLAFNRPVSAFRTLILIDIVYVHRCIRNRTGIACICIRSEWGQ